MATKIQNLQYQITEWCNEYGIDPKRVIVKGYANLDGDSKTRWTLGRCSYRYSSAPYSDIYLGERFEKRKLGWLETSVLYHEYCHAETYLEDGEANGHDKVFHAKRRRKPKYWIGDFVAKLLYPLF